MLLDLCYSYSDALESSFDHFKNELPLFLNNPRCASQTTSVHTVEISLAMRASSTFATCLHGCHNF